MGVAHDVAVLFQNQIKIEHTNINTFHTLLNLKQNEQWKLYNNFQCLQQKLKQNPN